jgi:hypothetical protein
MDYQWSWIKINHGLAAEHSSRGLIRERHGTRHLDRDVKLAPMPSTVEPLLVEDGQIEYFELSTDRKVWHDLILGAVRQLQNSSCCPSIRERTQTIFFAAGR